MTTFSDWLLKSWVRMVIGITLAATSAVLLTISFPPYPFWFFIFVAAVPFLVAQYRVLPDRWSALAPALAIGGWIGFYFTKIFGFGGGGAWYMRTLPLWIGALVFLMERGNRPLHERTAYRWFVLQGVVGWIGFEMIRSFIPNMGTWAFIGYPLYAQLWFIQPVSIFGIFGLDMLIILVNFVLTQVALALFDRKWRLDPLPAIGARATRRWVMGVGLAFLMWGVLGASLYLSVPQYAPTLRVAAIQPNLPRAAHIDTDISQEMRLTRLSAQTRQAAAEGAQIVVWPELGLGFDPQIAYTDLLRTLAAETQTYIVIGYGLVTEEGFRNEATVLSPGGEFLGIYGKAHPTVFGGEPYGINAGTFPVYDTPLGKLGTIICFDLNFTDASRRLASQGAQFIAVPSLDFPGIAALQYTQLTMRAIENRVAMVKADAAYDSAIIGPYGQIVDWMASSEVAEAILVADVPLGTGRTLYTKLGDWIGWLNLAGMVLFIIPNPLVKQRYGRGGASG
ncbi:MAG: apolipoprotein N-acyltransferase [Anaerolineae bacterium]|nr:apolipoprotein N-acyltransferase [Anaerolineae bacterium]